MTAYLGIDFGTTFTCISYKINEEEPKILLNENGEYTIPSIICFDKNSENIVLGHNEIHNYNKIHSWKRIIGKRFCEISKEELEYFKLNNMKLVEIEGNVYFEVFFNNEIVFYSTLDLTILFLKYCYKLIEQTIGKLNFFTVITIPVFFSSNSRSELINSYKKSGFIVSKVLNEPTSAALAFDFSSEQNVLVFDCGGGTTDLSYINIDLKENIFDVKKVEGDKFLGGQDLTNNLVKYILQKYNLKNTPKNIEKIYKEAEKCKQFLSKKSNHSYNFYIEMENDISIKITQSFFLNINNDFFNKINDLLIRFNSCNLDNIIIIGGSSRFFFLEKLINQIFPDINISKEIDPDKAVALGACKYSYYLNKKQEDCDQILLFDILPLSLGIETSGGLFDIIIPRNSTLPIKRTKYFTNDSTQKEIQVNIYQGESRFVENNYLLNSFLLYLDSSFQKGEVKIKIEFSIDTSGLFEIIASVNEKKIKTQITKNELKCRLPKNIDEIIHKFTINKLTENNLAKKILDDINN